MPQKFKRGTDLMNVSLQYVGLIYMPVMRTEDQSGPKSMVQTPDTKCDTVGLQSFPDFLMRSAEVVSKSY